MAEQAGVRWTIRGVPLELREAAEQAAGSKHRLGEWIADAIRRALEATDSVSDAGGGIAYRVELDALSERLAAVEKALGMGVKEQPSLVGGMVQNVLPPPEPEWFKPGKGTRKTLSDLGKAVRDRWLEEGIPVKEIAARFGITVEAIAKVKREKRKESLGD